MFSKTAFALAIMLATASGAFAATKTHNATPAPIGYGNGYNAVGDYVGTDPDLTVRFELNRDIGHGR
jgi:hypothetical protein